MGGSAFIVLDIQNGITDRVGGMEPYLERLASTVEAARNAGVQIVYIVTGFREGHPEASRRNPMTARVVESKAFIERDQSTKVHPAVRPEKGDVIVKKRRVSAFHATELDMILRSLDIQDIVVAGLITSGAVLSIVRQAADMDYKQIVLENLCMDRDKETHNSLMKLFAHQTQVLSSSEWIAGLQKTGA